MNKGNIKTLDDNEDEVYLWLEQESSIMLKAITKLGDPVELTSQQARQLALLLNQTAEELECL